MEDRIKAIAYVRVAAPKQEAEEQSFQIQKQQILEAAKDMDIDVVKWFEQAGYEPIAFRNSTLNQAIEYCEADSTIKHLLVANISRLSRSLDHCIYWQVAFERVGVTIMTVVDIEFDSPMESFQRNLSKMIGQLDHEHRSEMIKRGIQAKKAREA